MTSVRRLLLVLLPILLLPLAPVAAVEPDEILDDPALEARARALSKGIRCLVCQNEAIDSSNADLARELRILVRERLVAGDSDDQVLAFLVERYGDFVLMEPPMKPATWLLWFGPAVLLLLGGAAVVVSFRRRAGAVAAAPLTAEEQARVARLLDEQGPDGRS